MIFRRSPVLHHHNAPLPYIPLPFFPPLHPPSPPPFSKGEVGMGQAMLTDDVSLRVFMEHLMKLAVQTP